MKIDMKKYQNICENINIYGCLDDVQIRERIGRVLYDIPESDFEILWNNRQIAFFVAKQGQSGSMERLCPDCFSFDAPLFIVTAISEKNVSSFMEIIAHELAHVFYAVDYHKLESLDPERQSFNSAVIELMADLKAESWGYLEGHRDSYLKGSLWDFFEDLGVDKSHALQMAKCKQLDQVSS